MEKSKELSVIMEKALKQKKAVVQRITSLDKDGEAGEMKQLKAIRASLDKKIENVDNYLGLFKAAMSNLNRKISRVQSSITSQREILENLVTEQLSLTNRMDSNPGISIIEVTGTLKAGTRVAGQHTEKIIQETLRGATIKEVCISDQDRTCRWEITVLGK